MKWQWILILVLTLQACDDRAAGLRDINTPPAIRLQAERGGGQVKMLHDSVKVSNPAYSYMPFAIEVSDANENIKHVTYHVTAGGGQLVFRDEAVTDNIVSIAGNRAIYRFVPAGVGTTTVRFVVTDYFDQKDSATLQLHVFHNLAPVGMLHTSYLGATDRYEYLLDAGASYDPDQSFGGKISRYIFSVGGTKVAETLRPAVPFIFAGPGSYAVRLQVIDNDGAISREISQTVQVNP